MRRIKRMSLNRLLSNEDHLVLSVTEIKLILALRQLSIYDKLEIKKLRQGEIEWTLTHSERGIYPLP